MMDMTESATKKEQHLLSTITPEHLLRSMPEPTRLFRNSIPFNPCYFLSSSLFFHRTVNGNRVSYVPRPGFEPWVSNSISCAVATPTVHYPLKIKLLLKLV